MPDLNEDDSRLLGAVMTRASTDAEFRSELLKNPHRAVQGATGVTLPSNLRIRFVEQPSDVDALVVLPGFISTDGELSADELEAVAGGVAEMNAICWGTCDKTCGQSCTNTCTVTDISVPPVE
jgi:hypothetical protein